MFFCLFCKGEELKKNLNTNWNLVCRSHERSFPPVFIWLFLLSDIHPPPCDPPLTSFSSVAGWGVQGPRPLRSGNNGLQAESAAGLAARRAPQPDGQPPPTGAACPRALHGELLNGEPAEERLWIWGSVFLTTQSLRQVSLEMSGPACCWKPPLRS